MKQIDYSELERILMLWCRFSRQLVVGSGAFESSLGFDLYLKPQNSPIEVQLTLNDRFTLSTNALTDRCP